MEGKLNLDYRSFHSMNYSRAFIGKDRILRYYSLSCLGMARGYAYTGETAKARKAFQDFFELWKDADPDIPILQQAKAEYAELR